MRASVDLSITEWMVDHRAGWLTRTTRVMEDFGRSAEFLLLLVIVGLGVVAVRGLWRGTGAIAAAGFLTLLAVRVLKPIIDRPRPPADLSLTHLEGAAMPSTHAAGMAVLVTAVWLAPWWDGHATLRRVWLVGGVLVAVVTGAAMVYLGGHWFTDLLAGWALGITVAVVCHRVAQLLPRVAQIGR